jgi:DNA-binding beta-propeller fold protein YncE
MPDEANLENKLRGLLRDPRWSVRPRPDAQARIRQAARRQRVRRASLTGAAAGTVIVACAAIIPATIGLLGRAPGPAGGKWPTASTVYAEFDAKLTGTVVPISAASNRPGKPIHVGGSMAVTPDGKTLYVSSGASTIPISTATNRPGKPIHVAGYLTIAPTGKIAYAAGVGGAVGSVGGKITPVNLATNRPGKPVRVCSIIGMIAFTPDGKTAYVSCPSTGPSTVIPINMASNRPGKPIHVGPDGREIAITPDGKTAYVLGVHTVTPINTATNTPGKPIRLGANPTALIAVNPDGKTAYVGTIGTVIPISTTTNTPGKPIRIGAGVPAEEMVFTADGKTAYVANEEGPTGRVVPISTATGTVGKPILIGVGAVIAITPDGKALYAAGQNKVVPISTATNRPGKPIRLPYGFPGGILATP